MARRLVLVCVAIAIGSLLFAELGSALLGWGRFSIGGDPGTLFVIENRCHGLVEVRLLTPAGGVDGAQLVDYGEAVNFSTLYQRADEPSFAVTWADGSGTADFTAHFPEVFLTGEYCPAGAPTAQSAKPSP